MPESAPFKGVGGLDSLRRGLEPRRRRINWLRVNRHKKDKKGTQTQLQIGFIVEQHANNSGGIAASKAQLVAFWGVGDSQLIGIADACE